VLTAATLVLGGAVSANAGAAFPLRMVKSGAMPGDPALLPHLRYSAALGFDAVWFHGHQAGRWSATAAPDGPRLDPAFLEVIARCRELGLRPFLSINPVAESGGAFVFTSREDRRRILRLVRLLRRRAGIRDFVLSFDDQPTTLAELRDVFRYGASSAPAHLDLARAVRRALPRKADLWLAGAAYCDAHLGDGTGRYAKPFLAGLPELPERIGIVWTGPTVISPRIDREDIERARARLGGRRILLYDNYPINDGGTADALALILGPLRNRASDLREVVDAYLACPMAQLGASRLPLATIADYLADPERYDPDASWNRAMDRLAGGDEAARRALRVQAIEWGGWIGTRNYLPRDVDNPAAVARRLDDPAYVSLFSWTVKRYPSRMRDLDGLADVPFRDDLLAMMARRLAVARAVPVVVELRGRAAAGRTDTDELLDVLARQRRDVDRDTTRDALDAFLDAAGILPAVLDRPPS